MLILLALVTLSPCVNATPTEIAYDNGILGGNNASPFAGVRFSLPQGITSAELITVRFYWLDAGDPVTVHVTAADHVTELTTPIQTTGGGRTPLFKDLDVSNLTIILTGDFFIFLQQYPVSGVQNFGQDNSSSVGRSYVGETMSNLISYTYGNILIRAVVEPAWNTTSTSAMTSTPAFTFSSMMSSSTQSGPSPGNLIGMLSQTDLLLIGVVVVLAVLFAVVMLRRPRSVGRATGATVGANIMYCRKCGAQNAVTQQFCEKCGAKLRP
jgi:hypothetical protein